MRCRKARWYLSARCDDTLSERQRQRLETHLESCGPCRREAFYFSEIAAASTRIESVSVRPDFNLRLRAAVRRAEAIEAEAPGWRLRLTGWVMRPALAGAAVTMCAIVALGVYQYSEFRAEQDASAEKARIAEEGRLARDAAMGLSTAEPILPAGWTPVDGISPEMQRLQNQYLAEDWTPPNYIVESESLEDPLARKPQPQYVMPTVTSDQMVRQVSY